MKHKNFIPKWYDSTLESISHQDVNTIHSIIDDTPQIMEYPDVQQELFNRLLSGKKLTIHDEREIIDICSRRSATYHLTRSNIPK